jgi:hypothetical protein
MEKEDDDAITDAEIGVRSDLDHLVHIFMAEDVATQHHRLIAVEEMEIGAAYRAGGDPDDDVTQMLDFRIAKHCC